jgi:homocysteine S-methyltransferase
MGTMLYARGVFINRCYDELNISQPELVRAIHEEYVQAGAEIIETNTFGSNSFRLGRYGLQDQVRAINLAGVGLAREAVRPVNEKQSARILVAGSIGPLGAQMGPSGGPPKDAVRVAFAEQIAALDEGGVDLLMVETLTSLGEAHQAILAARETAPHLPLVVMVTVDEGGNCLDGHTPEETARLLTEWGADVVGCNCSAGPHAVLAAVERMRTVTTLPLAAIPNAGVPRSVDGRNIYLCSPEYMASYARKFVQAGVQFVGGCCGTTPDHIRAMRSALRALEARGTRHMISTVETAAAAIQPPPLAERSSLGARLAAKEFLTLVEIVPPRGIACARELDAARLLAQSGVHAINVPDSPRASARQSPLGLCLQIQHQTAMETVLHVTCRDRNTLSIQSDLLGAASLGLHNVLCVTGDPPKLGNYPDATAVFDVDSIGLVSIVRNLNHGLDIGNNAIGASTGFTIGVAANPGVPDIDNEVRRFAAKVEAGAEYAITQPVFDLHLLEAFLQRVEKFRIPVIAGIWPLTSLRNAEFMRKELGVSVPDAVMERMQRADTPERARAEGVQIAQEMLAAAQYWVQGAQVSAPAGRYAAAVEVLQAVLGTGPSRAPAPPSSLSSTIAPTTAGKGGKIGQL